MPPKRIPLPIGLALAIAGGALARAPEPANLEFHERFVAIDLACAWPNLSLLPDGRIAALIWPLPNHGITEGAAACWISNDDGATWKFAGVPVPNSAGTNRMNLAAGAIDGAIVTLVGGWDGRPPFKGAAVRVSAPHDGSSTLMPVAAVSTDAGASWTRFTDQNFPRQANGRALVPYGPIARLAGGEIAACLYLGGAHFYVSSDGGATWTHRGTLATEDTHNETAWVELENGDLFAASRTAQDGRVDAFRSTDAGRTWKSEGPLTLPRQHPAHLLRAADGRILLTYASRNTGLFAIWVRMGDPEAKSWSAPVMLVDLEGSTELQHTPVPGSDGGYPSTVQTADGTFVTAYYTRGTPGHQRYHMGVVRWRPGPETFPAAHRTSR